MVKKSEFVGYCSRENIPFFVIEAAIMFSLVGKKVDYSQALEYVKRYK